MRRLSFASEVFENYRQKTSFWDFRPGWIQIIIYIWIQRLARILKNRTHHIYEPRCEKTSPRGFLPGSTQTGLYNCTRWLEARKFVYRK